MTTSIRPGATFMGHPATKLRSLLASWAKGKRDPDSLAYLKSISLSPASVLALLGEAHDRGLIQTTIPDYVPEDAPDREEYRVCELSDAGRAVATATAVRRSPKTVAKQVLDKILDNAMTLARDPNALYSVGQIWVFGSYIDASKKDVGDLDIVVERKRLPIAETMDYAQKNDHIDRNYPGVVPESVDVFWKQDHWFKKMVFGARRHHLVAENTMDTLQGLHQPCALVFDCSRGGIIEPEYFEHHPDSIRRSAEIQERLVMPDLDATSDDFRMVSAEFYMPHFTGRNWQEHTVVVDKSSQSKDVQRVLKDIPIDGREHFAVLIRTDYKLQAVIHIHRSVHFGSSVWNYEMDVKCLYAAKNADYGRFGEHVAGELLWTLFNADIVRLAARRSQRGGYHDIYGDMIMCRRSAAIPDLTYEISRLHERWFFKEGECPHLQEDQRFGVMTAYEFNGGGYTELFFFDDEDWSRTSVVERGAFQTWLAQNDPDRYTELMQFQQAEGNLAA